MATKKVTTEVVFRLKGIEILDERLESHPNDMDEIKLFNFTVNVEQKINSEKKLVICAVEVLITSGKDNSLFLGSIKVGCIFEIENFELFYNYKTNKVSFPKTFESNMILISMSTTRGVMFSQFKGTYLHNAFLPVIAINSFVLNKNVPQAPQPEK